ncbi:unnamed protein product [Clonostachys byssicola]|uniref:Uncharacterized protein n=1 Tax=Clonostachys byssicola TaxID=160290 RepID=A0A9N9U3N6_9HYPO|nr:unnamed protein product [Clonostachys byssicola]
MRNLWGLSQKSRVRRIRYQADLRNDSHRCLCIRQKADFFSPSSPGFFASIEPASSSFYHQDPRKNTEDIDSMADPPHPGMRPGARDLFITNFVENPPPLAPDDSARIQPPNESTSFESDDEGSGLRHAKLENHCILCGDTLHVDRRSDIDPLSRLSTWEMNVICVLSIPSSIGQTQSKLCNAQISQRRVLRSRNLEYPPGTRYHACAYYTSCPRCDGEAALNRVQATVNLVHLHCSQLAKRRWGDFSADVLVRIARLLRPITLPGVAEEILGVEPGLTKFPESEIACKDSSLGSLLMNIHRHLPGELQRLVCQHLQGTFFFSVASCVETLHWIEDHRILVDSWSNTTPTYHYPLMPSFSFKRLVADTVNILGESCFTRIGGDFATSYAMEITLKQVPLSGIQYSLGLYGVVGLRVLYEDAHVQHGWVAAPADYSGFSAFAHCGIFGLKYLSLDSGTTSQALQLETSPEEPKMFWNHDIDFTPSDKYSLVTLNPIHRTIRGQQAAYIGQYLPFQPASQQHRSLTIFFSSEGTSCIQVGSDRAQCLGNPSAGDRALTFYLYPGETIKSLRLLSIARQRLINSWTMRDSTRFHILVQTSEGRMIYAAPSRVLTDPECSLAVFGGESSHFPDGMFLVRDGPLKESLTNLGVKFSATKEEQLGPQNCQATRGPWSIKVPRPRLGPPLPIEGSGAVLTKANLDNVKELRVQKYEGIYLGLLIHRHDDRIDVLGSWDASSPGVISTIYVYGDRPLTGLTFVLLEEEGPGWWCRNVVNIRTHPSSVPELDFPVVDSTLDQVEEDLISKFHWDAPHLEVAWWFTLSGSEDRVEYWNGEEQEFSLSKGDLHCEQVN